MEKGILEGNERIGLITFVMNDNAAANYRNLPLKVSSASAPKHIFAGKRLKCNAQAGS